MSSWVSQPAHRTSSLSFLMSKPGPEDMGFQMSRLWWSRRDVEAGHRQPGMIKVQLEYQDAREGRPWHWWILCREQVRG